MKLLKNSYIFIALCSSLLSADFVDVSVWKRLSEKGNEQVLVLCGDKHDLAHTGIEQSETIVEFLSARNNKHDHIVIEDLNDIEGFGKHVDGFFDAYPNDADCETARRGIAGVHKALEEQREECIKKQENDLLFVLPYLARKKNVSQINIDFRHFVSCGAMRFNVEEYQNGHLMIPYLLESVVQEIAAYDDGPVLNKRYAEIVERYTPFMQYICKIMRDNNIMFQDLIDYLVDACIANPQAFDPVFVKSIRTVDLSWNFKQLQLALDKVKKGDKSDQVRASLRSNFDDLLTLSSAELIDARMLHTLYKKQISNAENNIMFMCAGKAHNAIVADELSHLGYTLVDQIVDKEGVDMAHICESLVTTNNSIVTVWSYITDTVDTVVEYITELFA